MLTTTDIKNLSIALEALSRIPRIEDLALRVQSLLDEAITKTEYERYGKPVYPASPPPRAPAQSTEDDIPF